MCALWATHARKQTLRTLQGTGAMTDAEALEFAIKRLGRYEKDLACKLAVKQTNGMGAEYRETVKVLARLEIMLKREQRQGRMF